MHFQTHFVENHFVVHFVLHFVQTRLKLDKVKDKVGEKEATPRVSLRHERSQPSTFSLQLPTSPSCR
jgi:hypothetical protein